MLLNFCSSFDGAKLEYVFKVVNSFGSVKEGVNLSNASLGWGGWVCK